MIFNLEVNNIFDSEADLIMLYKKEAIVYIKDSDEYFEDKEISAFINQKTEILEKYKTLFDYACKNEYYNISSQLITSIEKKRMDLEINLESIRKCDDYDLSIDIFLSGNKEDYLSNQQKSIIFPYTNDSNKNILSFSRKKNVLFNLVDETYEEDTKKCSESDYEQSFGFLADPISLPYDIEVFSKNLGLSFSSYLLKLIDDRNLNDSDVYKKANIDRRLFSKIRSNEGYHPSKQTALAFAIALKLNVKETNELLEKAGYVLSDSSVADRIVRYYIENNIYDMYTINTTLFGADQQLLGGK